MHYAIHTSGFLSGKNELGLLGGCLFCVCAIVFLGGSHTFFTSGRGLALEVGDHPLCSLGNSSLGVTPNLLTTKQTINRFLRDDDSDRFVLSDSCRKAPSTCWLVQCSRFSVARLSCQTWNFSLLPATWGFLQLLVGPLQFVERPSFLQSRASHGFLFVMYDVRASVPWPNTTKQKLA